MKKSITLFLFLLCVMCNGQTFQWLQKQSFSESTNAYGVGTDAGGNVYTAGKFEPYYHGITPWGVFVTKYDTNGDVQWTDTSVTSNSFNFGAIANDAIGNTYLTISIHTPIDFGPNHIEPIGEYDNCLLVKYNTIGVIEWIKQYRRAGGYGLIIDKYNDIYLYGVNGDTINFGDGNQISFAGGFLAKYNSSGNSLWANHVAGSITSIITYDNDTSIYIRAGGIRKYNLNGILQSTSSLPGGKFVADKSGSLYLTGWFTSSITFGSTTLYSPSSYGAAFLAKRNAAGQYEWAVSPASVNYINLYLDSAGGLFVTGGSGYGHDPTTGFLLTKYDTANGSALWNYSYIARLAGGYPYSDGKGSVYVTGALYDAPHEKSMVLKLSENSVIGIAEESGEGSFSVYQSLFSKYYGLFRR